MSTLVDKVTKGNLTAELYKYHGPDFYRLVVALDVNAPIVYSFNTRYEADNFIEQLLNAGGIRA